MKRMRVLVIFNPISGAGRAAAAAEQLATSLAGPDRDVRTAATQRGHPSTWLDGLLNDREVLIVAGGDGAVRLAADAADRTGVALYQYPMGTENLFARAFGMSADPAQVAGALDARRIVDIDAGSANGEIFTLMTSVGFDADVVHDLDRRRRGAITRWHYVAAIMRQLVHWSPRTISVTVDGEPIGPVDGAPAMVVIANSRAYGARLDPARRASMTDGLLDVVYMPAANRASIAGWALACRCGRHLSRSNLIYRRGESVEVVAASAIQHQIDGDRATVPPSDRLTVSIRKSALRVLLPPEL